MHESRLLKLSKDGDIEARRELHKIRLRRSGEVCAFNSPQAFQVICRGIYESYSYSLSSKIRYVVDGAGSYPVMLGVVNGDAHGDGWSRVTPCPYFSESGEGQGVATNRVVLRRF